MGCKHPSCYAVVDNPQSKKEGEGRSPQHYWNGGGADNKNRGEGVGRAIHKGIGERVCVGGGVHWGTRGIARRSCAT